MYCVACLELLWVYNCHYISNFISVNTELNMGVICNKSWWGRAILIDVRFEFNFDQKTALGYYQIQ